MWFLSCCQHEDFLTHTNCHNQNPHLVFKIRICIFKSKFGFQNPYLKKTTFGFHHKTKYGFSNQKTTFGFHIKPNTVFQIQICVLKTKSGFNDYFEIY